MAYKNGRHKTGRQQLLPAGFPCHAGLLAITSDMSVLSGRCSTLP
jgi:hypothetical protein